MKCSVYIALLFLATASANEDDLRRIDSIVQEDPCRRSGGVCTIAADCPKGNLSIEPGLCPQQRSQGIECCYGISQRESRCVKHGGVCMDSDKFCNPNLIFKEAQDCPVNKKCCILTF